MQHGNFQESATEDHYFSRELDLLGNVMKLSASAEESDKEKLEEVRTACFNAIEEKLVMDSEKRAEQHKTDIAIAVSARVLLQYAMGEIVQKARKRAKTA
jgi:hypothetical protein